MISRAILFFFILSVVKGALILEEECLNYTVYPVQYELTITPYIHEKTSYFDCQLTITIIANTPDVRKIELDAKELEINGDSIKVYKGVYDIVNRARPYEYDGRNGKLYINLLEPLIPYNAQNSQYYNIKLTYRKYLKEDGEGIFLVKYIDENEITKYLYTTQLTPNKAKYFFPCFDNPRFEAVFKFAVYIIAAPNVGQYTNTSIVIAKEHRKEITPEKSVLIDYTPSPQVTINQIGFHYSTYANIVALSKNTNDTLMVWAPRSALDSYTFILMYGRMLIDLIHEYAAVNRPLLYGPINIIAVPSQRIEGYEISSWNLLVNRANRIAYQDEFTSIKQVEMMTFELAQQLSRIWLGNPGEAQRTRWREEWFKEGVATYMAYYFLAQYNYGSRTAGHRQPLGFYGLQMKNKAMAVDWQRSTPALATFNNTLAVEIPVRYRNLVTMKTASLLWMVENWIGSEKFHQALVKYINTRRGKLISLRDFNGAIDRDTVECMYQFFNGSTASKILHSWFHQPGYPVINVQVLRDRSPNAIRLSQKRFSFTDSRQYDSDYLIPISYIVQNNENCFNCYKPRFTIGRQTYTFGENLNGGWIILNRNASGYYRVNYDKTTWRLIARTLYADTAAIDELSRAQIVNDAFALYVAGEIDLQLAMEILDYLNHERNPEVWQSAMAGFDMLKTEGARCNMTRMLYADWQEFMKRKVSTMYKIVSNDIEQDHKSRLFRSNIVGFACSLKYEPCIASLKYTYEQHRHKNQRLDPDIRETCYNMLLETNGYFGAHKLNAFELDDKKSAEHRLREENRFLMSIPRGVPKPLPYIKTTTPAPIQPRPEPTVIADKQTQGSSSVLPTLCTFIMTALLMTVR